MNDKKIYTQPISENKTAFFELKSVFLKVKISYLCLKIWDIVFRELKELTRVGAFKKGIKKLKSKEKLSM